MPSGPPTSGQAGRTTSALKARKPRLRPEPIYAIARDEIARWHNLPRGLVMAILFAFIHRLTTGKTFEESFCQPAPEPVTDYQI